MIEKGVGDVLPFLAMGRIEALYPKIVEQMKSFVHLTVTKNRELINIIDGEDKVFMETIKDKARDNYHIIAIHATSTYDIILDRAEKIKAILTQTNCLESCLDCVPTPSKLRFLFTGWTFAAKPIETDALFL